MKFQARFQLPEINQGVFKKLLDKQLTDLLVESAKAWLEAGTFKVPVWSGAAASTFQELASRIGFTLGITPVSTAPDRRSLGRNEGTGIIEIDSNRGTYSFTYSTTLDHLIENETGASNFPGLITPTPYNFREAALMAWQQVARTAKLPGLAITIKGRTYG